MYTEKLKYSENLMHLLKKTKFSSTFSDCPTRKKVPNWKAFSKKSFLRCSRK